MQLSAAEQLDASDVAACAADGLAALLSMDDKSFWAAAADVKSRLSVFIDTYLRFAPRR